MCVVVAGSAAAGGGAAADDVAKAMPMMSKWTSMEGKECEVAFVKVLEVGATLSMRGYEIHF